MRPVLDSWCGTLDLFSHLDFMMLLVVINTEAHARLDAHEDGNASDENDKEVRTNNLSITTTPIWVSGE